MFYQGINGAKHQKNLERRLSASKVKKLLPKQLYNRVASILLLSTPSDYLISVDNLCYENSAESFETASYKSETGSNVIPEKTVSKETAPVTSGEKECHLKELSHGVATDLHMHPPSLRSRSVTVNASTSRTPQFKFMQLSEEEAAWWRPDTTTCDISLLPLEERAKIVTTQIIADFVKWQKNFLQSDIPILTEGVLAELFEVDFDKPIAHSLCIHLKEIPYVTPMVSKECAMPEKEYSAGLHSQILKDVRQEKQHPHTVAFGTTLPSKPRLRVKPPNNHVKEEWLDASEVTKHLLSMESVFKEITNLRSTIKFCHWLEDHPDTPPAKYLCKCGLIKPPPAHLKKAECHVASTKSVLRRLETLASVDHSSDVMHSGEMCLARSLIEASQYKTAT